MAKNAGEIRRYYQVKTFLFFIFFSFCIQAKELTVATWNIQNIGNCKLSTEHCTENKAEIIDDIHHEIFLALKDVDLIFIQELSTDVSVKDHTIEEFVSVVKPEFKYFVSKNVGTSGGNSERFLVIYNPKLLSIETTEYIEEDCIVRSPLIIKFHEIPHYFITTHVTAKKDRIIPELKCIEEYKTYGNFVLLGDTNADCGYHPRTNNDISKTVFTTDQWLIKTGEDTTVRERTSCTYDRVVGSKDVKFGKYHIYREFTGDEKFQLQISDHYPVIFKLNY
jgi:hypothetical protein